MPIYHAYLNSPTENEPGSARRFVAASHAQAIERVAQGLGHGQTVDLWSGEHFLGRVSADGATIPHSIFSFDGHASLLKAS